MSLALTLSLEESVNHSLNTVGKTYVCLIALICAFSYFHECILAGILQENYARLQTQVIAALQFSSYYFRRIINYRKGKLKFKSHYVKLLDR